MIVYRALSIPDNNIILDKLGIYYSKKAKSAYPYGNKHNKLPSYYLFKCFVENKYINWDETLKANKNWPEESEIHLYANSHIKVLNIKELRITTQELIKTYNIEYYTKT